MVLNNDYSKNLNLLDSIQNIIQQESNRPIHYRIYIYRFLHNFNKKMKHSSPRHLDSIPDFM